MKDSIVFLLGKLDNLVKFIKCNLNVSEILTTMHEWFKPKKQALVNSWHSYMLLSMAPTNHG